MRFAAYVQRAVDQVGNQFVLAQRLGVHYSRVSRVLASTTDSFDLVNCLRLAQILGESPVAVLKAAGKGDDAELLVSLFGEARAQHQPDEAEVLTLYRSLPLELRAHARELLQSTARVAGVSPPSKTTRKKAAG